MIVEDKVTWLGSRNRCECVGVEWDMALKGQGDLEKFYLY